ncbi:MAG: GTPase ObgE [Bacilli bacterium]|nr:GTPase ObgE [Bacilli bacterium]
MFVDEVILELYAGDGGDGCMAFRREKYVAMGGPFGGNGGKGSDIIFKVDSGLNTLIDFKYKKIIKGKNGENGLGKGKHGKNAENIIIRVPEGTVVTDYDTNLVIADLTKNGEEAIIAQGGRGGRGNMAFATQNNPAPKFAENGEPGEYRKIKVELKLMADVGLVGKPSVGKSTIISKVSASKPKIADYPFTTLKPNLGVVKVDDYSFVLADLPGLIEGASLGSGLGDKFLKHVERTKVIVHVIDMSGLTNDPYEDYVMINSELDNFNKNILKKKQIIIANKMDMPNSKENLKSFKKKVKEPIYEVSALNNIGLDKVMYALKDLLKTLPDEKLYEEDNFENHVLYKFEEEKPFIIIKENNYFILKGEKIEKLFKMSRLDTDEAILRFSNKLRKMGVDDELKKMGAQEGDTVKLLDFEFEYKD